MIEISFYFRRRFRKTSRPRWWMYCPRRSAFHFRKYIDNREIFINIEKITLGVCVVIIYTAYILFLKNVKYSFLDLPKMVI